MLIMQSTSPRTVGAPRALTLFPPAPSCPRTAAVLRECAAVRAGEAERLADGSISMEDHRRCETGATWSTRRETVPAPDFRRPVSDP